MTLIGILLLLTGVYGLFVGMNAYGDIGLAGLAGGLAALFSGIGILIVKGHIKKLEDQLRK